MHPLGLGERQQNIVLAVVAEGEAGTPWVGCHTRGRSSNKNSPLLCHLPANGESPAISDCSECVKNSEKNLIFLSKKGDYYCAELGEEAVEATQPVHCWCCPGVMKQRCKCEPVEWAQLGFRLL